MSPHKTGWERHTFARLNCEGTQRKGALRHGDPRMNTVLVLATVAVVLVIIFDYTNGFHDASNIIATTIASRAMTGLRLSA